MKKTVCGIIAILLVMFMMMRPLAFFAFALKGVWFVIVWSLCSLLCRLIFHRSLTDLIFGGDNK